MRYREGLQGVQLLTFDEVRDRLKVIWGRESLAAGSVMPALQLAVAALHHALATESACGAAFRRRSGNVVAGDRLERGADCAAHRRRAQA